MVSRLAMTPAVSLATARAMVTVLGVALAPSPQSRFLPFLRFQHLTALAQMALGLMAVADHHPPTAELAHLAMKTTLLMVPAVPVTESAPVPRVLSQLSRFWPCQQLLHLLHVLHPLPRAALP